MAGNLRSLSEFKIWKTLEPLAGEHRAHLIARPKLKYLFDDATADEDRLARLGDSDVNFVVIDDEWSPLFAVEYEGADRRAQPQDPEVSRFTNMACRELELPLARVTRRHVFEQVRGYSYVEWLAEMYFAQRAIDEAYENGTIPAFEYVDPMSMMGTHGGFPLWISHNSRLFLRRLSEQGRIQHASPLLIQATAKDESSRCIAVTVVEPGKMVIANAAIYLRGFGITDKEAAAEIAVSTLEKRVQEYLESGSSTETPPMLRKLVERTFQECTNLSVTGDSAAPIGFSISREFSGKGSLWTLGSLGNEPSVEFEE
ncbi:hypothetical protein FIV42_00600 [Persicimonas caeni]|uniref:Uncharacterized protein n=1 Tax=Persicimonas caeni TaxID=2292766 RepID=A0A4Y6PM44_PERCE|nr:hypothetical protein [Persicimonas caeni]QDG49283.1 hypothetical protein FIV42_00600 [Persicimonas caeni]QED30504.1 hypothetical protein FRD00_00595 [Persicimonas caeni]